MSIALGTSRLFLILILLVTVSITGYSQEEDEPIQFPDQVTKANIKPVKISVLKIAPIALIMGQIPWAAELRLIGEVAVNSKNSVFLGLSLNFQNFLTRSIWDAYNDTSNSQNGSNFDFVANIGWRIQGGYKFYLTKKQHAPEGLFVGPHLSYNRLKVTDKSNNSQLEKAWVTFWNINLIGGYQLIAGRFTLEAVTGIGYKRNYVDYYYRVLPKERHSWYEDESKFNRVKFSLSVNLGIAF